MPLNTRQARFVEAYVQSGIATKAAQEAGYSAKTAYSIGQRLLKHVEVRQAIDLAQAKARTSAGIDASEIARHLAGIARAEVGEPVRWAHRLKALELLLRHASLEELSSRVDALQALVQAQLAQGQRNNGHAYTYPR